MHIYERFAAVVSVVSVVGALQRLNTTVKGEVAPFDVAHHAFLPTLVERHRLAEASAFATGGWLVQL